MFICLILVFNTHFTFFLLKTCVAGWGFPLIIVAITLGVNKTESYGYTSSGICWVQRPEFYYVVVGPVLFTLVVNCTVFLMILHQLLRLSRLSGQTSLNESSTKRLARNFRSAVSLFVLLGLTWVFAFMAIGAANTVFTYLFALFSSLQGLFMFTLYCLLKEEVWTVLKNLCCGKDEFSDIKKNTMTTSSTFYKSSLNEEETVKDSYNITNKISHESVESAPLKDTGDTT
ncbi:adhesion G-protein coupled receptor G6-like [Physella acuta]|nr:adhesion G-protein coupled receptor G6-like [Physella acuta]